MAKPYDKAITPQQISALLRQMGALKSETGPAGRVRGYHDVSAGYEVSRDKWVSGDGHVMIVWQGGNWDKHYAEMKAFLESKGFIVEQDNVGLHVRAKQEAAPTPPTPTAAPASPSIVGDHTVGGTKVTVQLVSKALTIGHTTVGPHYRVVDSGGQQLARFTSRTDKNGFFYELQQPRPHDPFHETLDSLLSYVVGQIPATPAATPSKGGMVDVGSKVTIVRGHNSVKGRTGTVVTRGINKLTVQMDHGGGRTIEVPTNSVELI